ncbi:MAG: sigma-70 family RNA polymerase sigma factor [Acidobacteriota bacterium]
MVPTMHLPSDLDAKKIDELLRSWSQGDPSAREKLWPIVFQQLRHLARRQLDLEDIDHSLESSALVSEAYMRLNKLSHPQWETSAQFFALCAKIMRHVLVDHARARLCLKRPPKQEKVPLDAIVLVSEEKGEQLIDLDEALTRLAEIHPRKSDVVEMRFFGGLSMNEIAEVLQVSNMTVKRDWKFARAWLQAVLSGEIPDESPVMPNQ